MYFLTVSPGPVLFRQRPPRLPVGQPSDLVGEPRPAGGLPPRLRGQRSQGAEGGRPVTGGGRWAGNVRNNSFPYIMVFLNELNS